MRICVVGWYGTETLGDRSILLGIACIFSQFAKTENNTLQIASLYPFLTRRTLFEDKEFLQELTSNINIDCFDVKDNKLLKKEILNADCIIMGGGPLMDLDELKYIERIFKFASKKNKLTILFGCGVGSLTRPEFKKCVYKIIKDSSLCIFRDVFSKEKAEEVCSLYGYLDRNKLYVLHDPAFIPPLIYKEKYCNNLKKTNEIVINLRDYPYEMTLEQRRELLKKLDCLFNNLLLQCPKIQLLSNHNFYVGGDDRKYFSDYLINYPHNDIYIEFKPLSLKETFGQISNKKYCIAMRYHAILFQTVLNGNNYILDYTEPKIGKTSGFLNTINGLTFYKNRYFNILTCPERIQLEEQSYKINIDYNDIVNNYISLLKKYS